MGFDETLFILAVVGLVLLYPFLVYRAIQRLLILHKAERLSLGNASLWGMILFFFPLLGAVSILLAFRKIR